VIGKGDGDTTDWSFLQGRVAGRLFVESDRALYVALYTDPTVMAHVGPPMAQGDAGAAFEKVLQHNRNPAARARYWRLSHTASGEAIGLFALVRDAADAVDAEVGVMLLPAWQNRGAGVRALEGVVDGVMSGRWLPGIDVLIGRHAADNPNAGRLTEALGFRRGAEDAAGRVVWRLDRGLWAARRAGGKAARSVQKQSSAAVDDRPDRSDA
jgi:[ribosomal protein S5]-alanine N-acetyltransferase